MAVSGSPRYPHAFLEGLLIQIARLKGIRISAIDAGFDPLTATDAQLLEHYFPPRPDPLRTPIAHASWAQAMESRPFCQGAPAPPGAFGQNVVVLMRGLRTKSQESSRNWSGAFVRPRTFDSMALVQGRWTVPDTPRLMRGQPDFASSVWIGLDGHDPASRVMPQIGTGQLARVFPQTPNQPETPVDAQVAWWQLWTRGGRNLWQVPIPIPVERRDSIYAQIHAFDDMRLSFFIKNETKNVAYASHYYFQDDYTSDAVDPALRPLERRTAEWIVERPLSPDRLGPEAKPIALALAKYGTTTFTDCNAATAAPDGTLQEFQLQRAGLIRMNVWDEPGHRGRLASKPERYGDRGIRMSYVP
jgi:hypothetical protein